MKWTRRARARPLAMMAAAGLALATTAGAAQAQSVYFSGYTNGCFGAACVPVDDSGYQPAALAGLWYENSTFDGTTFMGFAGIGENANALGVQDVDNFGGLYLANSAYNYGGSVFKLMITLVDPTNYANVWTAMLTGAVGGGSTGGIHIDFDNNPIAFGGGKYTLSVNDVSMLAPPNGTPYRLAPITGTFTATAVTPEPMSLALLGTGLVGLAGVALRRRRRDQDAA